MDNNYLVIQIALSSTLAPENLAKMKKELSAKDKKLKARLEEQLQNEDPQLYTRWRRLNALIPSDPRCTSCMIPFEGPGGKFFNVVFNQKRSTLNPLMCNKCEEIGKRLDYGAEVEMSMLFADIRGSTPLAESMSATEFKKLIQRFYNETTSVLVHSYAIIDKLVGDEVTGYFIPTFIGGKDYAQRSVKAAQKILQVTGHANPEGPWAPVGVGVHTDRAYFGTVSSSDGLVEFTALGDAVNTAARLATQAATGEIVISKATAEKAEIDTTNLEKRTLDLKGKSEPMDVWVMRVMQE